MTTGRHAPRNFPQRQVQFPGDHRLSTIGRQLESAVIETGHHGPVVANTRTLRDAIGLLGRTGGRIIVGEGIYRFNAQLLIGRPNVHIMSTSPGKTVFKRTATEATAMIKFTGAECIFEGIRFIDENSTGYCLETTGDRTIVRNCFFEDVNGGIKVDGADFCTVEGNHFVDAGGTNIEFANTCVGALISNNRFETGLEFNILLSTGTTESTMVGNVLDWASGEISSPYRATGMQALATIPLVNVVDSSSNITETV